MSSKRKTKSKSNRYKNNKKVSSSKKSSKPNKKRSSIYENDDNEIVPLSLSPFYSFSSHWSYITRQYLCLSTWGTCMGGINEQYDDIMEYEAAIPVVKKSYERSLERYKTEQAEYNKEKQKIDRYNKYQQAQYDKFNQQYKQFYHNVMNNNNNNINYDITNNNTNIQNNYYDTSKNLSIEHKCPIHNIPPSHPSKPLNITPGNEGNIMNSPSPPKKITVRKIEADDQEYKQQITPGQTPGDNPERIGDDGKVHLYPQLSRPKKGILAVNSNIEEPITPKHVKGNASFVRKFNQFDIAAQDKKRRDTEAEKWQKQRSHASAVSNNSESGSSSPRKYKPLPRENEDKILETKAYYPAAHSSFPKMKRKVSSVEHSQIMKSMEDADAIIRDDKLANDSVFNKVTMFQQRSAGYDDDDK